MADDVIVDFLHVEIVHLLYNKAENDPKEESLTKLEQVGYSAGYRLAERLTRDWPRFKDELDTMKYICKDFWMAVFKKQIDNLRTNYQGVYALQDNQFRFLARMPAGKQQLDAAPRYVALACGVLRGALANLGLQSLVTAEVAEVPACRFHIQIQRI